MSRKLCYRVRMDSVLANGHEIVISAASDNPSNHCEINAIKLNTIERGFQFPLVLKQLAVNLTFLNFTGFLILLGC